MNKLLVISVMMIVFASSALAYGILVGPFENHEQMLPYEHDPVFYNTLGYKLAQEGKNTEAQIAFAHAVELKSDYTNARSNLATIAFANKDYNAGIENLRYLVAHNPTNNNYKFDLAQNLVAQAHYVDYDVAKLNEAATIFESLGNYPHASENAVIVRNVLADVAAAQE